MSLTSASFTAIFENTVPAFTFLVALGMGFDGVHLRRRDGWAKVLGTLLCMLGAMIMAGYKGPTLLGTGTAAMPGFTFVAGLGLGGDCGLSSLQHTLSAFGFLSELGLSEWQLGTGILLLGCLMWSLYLTWQVPVLREFPAPL